MSNKDERGVFDYFTHHGSYPARLLYPYHCSYFTFLSLEQSPTVWTTADLSVYGPKVG